MPKIDFESIKKIGDVHNLLNQLEIKGASNVSIMYNVLLALQQILAKIEEDNKPEPGITIDNTKKG